MCMEDVRMGRQSEVVPVSVNAAGGVSTPIVSPNLSRVSLRLAVFVPATDIVEIRAVTTRGTAIIFATAANATDDVWHQFEVNIRDDFGLVVLGFEAGGNAGTVIIRGTETLLYRQ